MASQRAIGFFAGSFDPVTNGHIDVIQKGLSLFDKIIIGVGLHATKQPLLKEEDRVDLLQRTCAEAFAADINRIHIITFTGLTLDTARENGATALMRGLRDSTDFNYEMQICSMNAALDPHLQTVFLPASSEVRFISSTLVRQIALMKGNIRDFVPAPVADYIENTPLLSLP